MTTTQTGWVLILAGLAVVLTSMAPEIQALPDWSALASPGFVGKAAGHLGGALMMALGGKLLPTGK